jgi:hypothetical protein
LSISVKTSGSDCRLVKIQSILCIDFDCFACSFQCSAVGVTVYSISVIVGAILIGATRGGQRSNSPARVKSEGLWDEKIIVFISVGFLLLCNTKIVSFVKLFR